MRDSPDVHTSAFWAAHIGGSRCGSYSLPGNLSEHEVSCKLLPKNILPNAPSNHVPGLGFCPTSDSFLSQGTRRACSEKLYHLHRAQSSPRSPQCTQNCSLCAPRCLGDRWLSTSQGSKCNCLAQAGQHPRCLTVGLSQGCLPSSAPS